MREAHPMHRRFRWVWTVSSTQSHHKPLYLFGLGWVGCLNGLGPNHEQAYEGPGIK
jgi:hypothetical protein